MSKKKTTRPTTQATAIPIYITVAERLARETCARLKTAPEQAAKNLNAALAKHGGHTGGLRSVTADDLFSDPERIIQAARGNLQKDVTEERLAAVLWIGAQSAKVLSRQPDGNAAALADLSWTLSRIATALRFPELREQIMQEHLPHIRRGKKTVESASLGGKARAALFKREKKAWKDEDKKLREKKPRLSKLDRAKRIAVIHGGKVDTIRKNI